MAGMKSSEDMKDNKAPAAWNGKEGCRIGPPTHGSQNDSVLGSPWAIANRPSTPWPKPNGAS